MKPLHLAAALLMVTIRGVARRARPFGDVGQIPFRLHGTVLR